jgi:anti-repressor protein
MCKTEKGRECRQYLIDLEKAWNTPEQIMARALRIADQTIANLHKQLEEQKPLVEFADRVSQSSDTVDMAEMAKLVKDEGIEIGRNRLINWMKEQKYLLNNNTPYQKYVDAGYMKVVDVPKDTPYGTRSFTKTVFTGKGQIWIVEKLRDNYKVKK